MMENPHDIREMNKIGLETYLEEYEFPDLEVLLQSAIENLYIEAGKAEKEFKEANKKEAGGEYYETPYILDEIFSIENRLLSIYEMIIINDYKEFELILKRLLKASLDFDEKDFRSFENLKPIFKSKGIIFSDLKNYNDINDLRKVNNYIKHSNNEEIPDTLKQIIEFRKSDKLNFIDLKKFHQRIKDLRYNFIFDLKEKIFSHLYHYDENRINGVAVRMIKRMDSKQIDLLIKKLKELK
jgi:hypothetical protein